MGMCLNPEGFGARALTAEIWCENISEILGTTHCRKVFLVFLIHCGNKSFYTSGNFTALILPGVSLDYTLQK